ncbi:alpha/beta hydrolase domain-containing protein [Listeria seeligeri FSL S4-171]|uniref:alpha/beta hydrolase n=1 Tax=Listeria seeligeri TaxID=1640 RepID=UPI0001EB7E47|nr:alpha/beta hydrolase [Listeria seeligeri]EFS03578.1 alpha/beta hydrolase domain-containing protein [Listeria seeligeri FSL S4-171]MBF2665209.1 alpha/beta hydrolase [Listeria seeligeri]
MERKYPESLVADIKKKQEVVMVDDVKVIVKNIPDCDIKGAADPRLYKEMKKMALISNFIPKSAFKMDASPKSLARLRKMFNSIDSYPMVKEEIEITEEKITANDGYDIPMYCFKTKTPMENSPILYFIHGGGFFAGSVDVVTEALKLFVVKTNMIAFSIDYRLAPENPYPIGHEDCYAGLNWIYENADRHGGDATNIFVAGDSAGGNLTQYCTNRALEDDTKMVKGQMLLYPTVNMGGVKDEHVNYNKDKFDIYPKHAKVINMSLDMMVGATEGLGDFLGTKDLMNKYLTPYMDVSPNLPPTFLTVGEHDFLKVETLAYARKLKFAGVDTKTVVYKGLGHAYIDKVGYYPQSEDCIQEIIDFILKYKG